MTAALMFATVLGAATGAGVALLAIRRGALRTVGWLLVIDAVWLWPQRPDTTTKAVISAVFGLGITAALRRYRGVARSRRIDARNLATGLALVLIATAITSYIGASTINASWFGGGVTHGRRDRNEVALTFDDGPNIEATPAIMALLDDAHVQGAFFIVGKALDRYPEIVRDLVHAGHLVGNHSYEHDQWRWLDPRYPELARTQQAFERHHLPCPAWFRPPHGQRTPFMARVVHNRHMHLVLWDVSANDWSTSDPALIARRVLRNVRAGSIIDLHDSLDGNPFADRRALVRAIPLILDGLRAKHLRVVRLDKLLGGAPYTSCR